MRRWIAPASWAALLLYLGSRPPDALPSAWWLDDFDKFVHAGIYAPLGCLVAWAGRGRRGLLWGALAGLLWGALDEAVQSTVGRTADGLDLLADVIGAALGGWAAIQWGKRDRSGYTSRSDS